MTMQCFYSQVPVISDFQKVADGSRYKPAPNDWWVVVGDIRNSTEAIEKGHYKEVNMAGTTIITAVSNIYKEMGQLPFTFGGDGAFVLIPDTHIEEVQKTLLFCRDAIKGSFDLDMRVGMMQVKEVRDAGYEIKVAKLKLSPHMDQALFWGDGLAYAEEVIKNRDNTEEEALDPNYSADLEGLECRWQEIPPSEDEITSYIIKARGGSDEGMSDIYSSCLQKVEEVYGSMNERNPVPIDKLNLTRSWQKLKSEWKIRTWKPTLARKISYRIKLMFEAVVGEIAMNNGIKMRDVNWGDYKSDFLNHVDFRKFGEGLRFVASGTAEERNKMDEFLQQEYKKGHLFYGVHSSESLIITCYITNHEKKHIHFVDGVDGGYSMAAKKLKKQIKQGR